MEYAREIIAIWISSDNVRNMDKAIISAAQKYGNDSNEVKELLSIRATAAKINGENLNWVGKAEAEADYIDNSDYYQKDMPNIPADLQSPMFNAGLKGRDWVRAWKIASYVDYDKYNWSQKILNFFDEDNRFWQFADSIGVVVNTAIKGATAIFSNPIKTLLVVGALYLGFQFLVSRK